MVSGKHKTRRVRKVFRRTPGGNVKTYYTPKKVGKATCAGCGSVLSGTLSDYKAVMQNTAKSKKRPERPFGGVLCSKCMRLAIVERARSEEQ